jgi:phosphatidylserine/phosphatidylglycerophosphate/cardiolipin synthase-like enzyme
MNELENYQFELWEESESPEVSFHRPNKDLKDEIISTGDRETIVVSPFVTDEKWDNNFILYTSSGTAESLKNTPSGGVYYLDVTNISLHGKIYITHLENETKVWIGSANFTTSAFSEKNSEILVCLTYKDENQEIYAALKNTFEEKINNKYIWQKKSQNVENTEEIEVEK